MVPRDGEPGSFKPGEIVVRLKPGVTDAQINELLEAQKLRVVRRLRSLPFVLLEQITPDGKPASEQATLDGVKAVRASGRFAAAKPNFYRYKGDVTPNDPLYNQQWGYGLVNFPKAWEIPLGASNVILACLDTGVDVNHPDLTGRFIGQQNFTVFPNNSDVTDRQSHGTHVTGTMSATTNNGVGVAGSDFGASKLFAGKVLGDDGFGTYFDIADGVLYCADVLKKANNNVVINMSLGGATDSDEPDLDDPLEAACVYAAQKDCLVTMCAQNWYEFGNPSVSPARTAQLDPRLFCVTAVGRVKEHSAYSIARFYSTIAAPGGNAPEWIISTLPTDQGSYGGPNWQGTSMATPHVSGLISMVLTAGARPLDVKGIITQTADTGGRSVPNAEFGWGVIDAQKAVLFAKAGIGVSNPQEGQFVYGTVPITVTATDQSVLQSATVTIDNDPTVIGTASPGNMVVAWNTRATDPTTGQPALPNGTHRVRVSINTTFGALTVLRTVRVDNPVAIITTPTQGAYATKKVDVTGTVDGLRIPTYSLDYALASAPTTWIPFVTDQKAKVSGGSLTQWDLNGVADGSVLLRLRVKNPDDFEVETIRTVTVDQTPPSIPAAVTGTPAHQRTSLSWGGSTDPTPGQLVGYNVYRSNQSLTGYAKVSGATPQGASSYADLNLVNGNSYFYQVTAVDAAGNESAPSEFIALTPQRNGTAKGQVKATDGSFVVGAAVNVLQNGTVVTGGTAATDQAGTYAFPGPPGFDAGEYELTASAAGYVPQVLRPINIQLGRDAMDKDFTLQPLPVVPSGWAMLTLPYDFNGKDLTAVIGAGGQVKAYNPATGAYVNPGQAGFPAPAPGVGYWVNRSAGAVSVNEPGVPVSPARPTEVAIRKGWNLLGNPYQFPIRWNLNNLIVRRADTGLQATLNLAMSQGWALDVAWGGANGRTLIYDKSILPNVEDTIPGYGAFWFRSEVDGTLSISPPAIVNRSANGSGSQQWALQINARSGNSETAAYVGVAPTRRTMAAAPEIEPGLRLGLTEENATRETNGAAVDLRAAGGTQVWDLTVTNPGDQAVTLTWPGASTLPRGWALTLYDKATGQRVNLRNTSSYTVPTTRASRTLQIELARETGQRMLITDLQVNASRSTAPAISFNLTREGQTAVSIVKANGETVRLISSRALRTGANHLIWDGRDNQGRSVAPGVYLVQVRVQGDRGEVARAIASFMITR